MKPRIQIIDDNVALTTLLAKALSKFGFDPIVENNPLLALNSVRHYMPDLILLDVMMPERDGGRVLWDLRNDLSLRYIPVILLTAIAREAQTLANTGGIQSLILSKPVQLQDLVATIKQQLDAAMNSPKIKELEGRSTHPHFPSAQRQEMAYSHESEPWATRSHPAGHLATISTSAFSAQFPQREPDQSTESPFSFPHRDEGDSLPN